MVNHICGLCFTFVESDLHLWIDTYLYWSWCTHLLNLCCDLKPTVEGATIISLHTTDSCRLHPPPTHMEDTYIPTPGGNPFILQSEKFYKTHLFSWRTLSRRHAWLAWLGRCPEDAQETLRTWRGPRVPHSPPAVRPGVTALTWGWPGRFASRYKYQRWGQVSLTVDRLTGRTWRR